MSTVTDPVVEIRSYRPEDHRACLCLYTDGLIGGSIASNDTALDLDDIAATYLQTPGSHFWVAQNAAGEVVGMIGVQHHDEDEGEIRRLRVRQDHRRHGIGTALLETAIRFCRDNDYLKVTVDTFIPSDLAEDLFRKFHFRHDRTRTVGERDLLYFYLDLYERDRPRRR